MDVGGAASTAANQFEWFTKKGDPEEGFIPMLTQNLKDFHKEFDKKDAIERFDQALQNLAAAGKPLKNLVIDPLLATGARTRTWRSRSTSSVTRMPPRRWRR